MSLKGQYALDFWPPALNDGFQGCFHNKGTYKLKQSGATGAIRSPVVAPVPCRRCDADEYPIANCLRGHGLAAAYPCSRISVLSSFFSWSARRSPMLSKSDSW